MIVSNARKWFLLSSYFKTFQGKHAPDPLLQWVSMALILLNFQQAKLNTVYQPVWVQSNLFWASHNNSWLFAVCRNNQISSHIACGIKKQVAGSSHTAAWRKKVLHVILFAGWPQSTKITCRLRKCSCGMPHKVDGFRNFFYGLAQYFCGLPPWACRNTHFPYRERYFSTRKSYVTGFLGLDVYFICES